MNQICTASNVPSQTLKTQIIDECYNGATKLEGYRYLAGIHPLTKSGIFVVDGNQDRAVYKAMIEEAQQAGLHTKRLIVYGECQTYSGPSIDFSRFDHLGLPNLARKEGLSDIPAFAADLDQQFRYLVPVKSDLVSFLPKTDFRPEAMRVTRRESANGVWFEVETYHERMQCWIQQKDHPTAELALQDANGWYPDPAASSPVKFQQPVYTQGQVFEFSPGDPVIGNGCPGTVIRMYSKGMVEVRLPGGIGCIPSSYPDCYPAPLGEKGGVQ